MCVCCVPVCQTDDEVEARLAELGRLVPDMVNRMECTRADILLSMLQNTAGTVSAQGGICGGLSVRGTLKMMLG